ncbi:MAG: phosphate ABC transporter substrate-binding protein, partial [Pseudomonadales bacterium]|nr:phosphate ABC transporter substrate-binding protein [Pseudomonadales bacterium]
MNTIAKFAKAISTTGLLIASTFASAEVVVVVSSDSAIGNPDAQSLQQLFLGKRDYIGDASAVPIDQSEGNEARDEFYSKVIDKTPSQLNAYWSRLIFTGKGAPPKQYFDDAEIIEVILEDDEAVG